MVTEFGMSDASGNGQISTKNIGRNDGILLRMADGLAIMKKKGKESILWKRKEKNSSGGSYAA